MVAFGIFQRMNQKLGKVRRHDGPEKAKLQIITLVANNHVEHASQASFVF